jgi:hypothetical protein
MDTIKISLSDEVGEGARGLMADRPVLIHSQQGHKSTGMCKVCVL